jgi:hypothetical protein
MAREDGHDPQAAAAAGGTAVDGLARDAPHRLARRLGARCCLGGGDDEQDPAALQLRRMGPVRHRPQWRTRTKRGKALIVTADAFLL